MKQLIIIFISLIFLINKSFSKIYPTTIENGNKVIIAHPIIPSHWSIDKEFSNLNDKIEFKFLLKQNNLNKLNYYFNEINNPKSNIYGEFLNKNEIKELVKSDDKHFNIILNYLKSNSDINDNEIQLFSDYIKVFTTIEKVSKLMNCKFSTYRNQINNKLINRLNGAAYVPLEILDSIDFISGLSEFFDNFKMKITLPTTTSSETTTAQTNKINNKDILITPNILKNYYNVPLDQVGNATNNKMGVIAFNDYFSIGALEQFNENYNFSKPNVTRIGVDCLGKGCDQYESDLDIQYITAMGQGIDTDFIGFNDAMWILDYTQNILEMNQPPLVQSISYGWSELLQCDLSNGCSAYGYNDQQYVERTNTEFQKLGTLGLTILVSSGDDGSPSLGGSSGNCPIDPQTYCPNGGCTHNTSMCSEITIQSIKGEDQGKMCFFPMGIGSATCSTILGDPNVLDSQFTQFSLKNKHCNLSIEYDQTNLPHIYSECSCSDLVNSTSKNYHFSPYIFNKENGPIFTAEYPSTSPFVTSVGATQFIANDNNEIIQEIGCSIYTGAKITSGGGFSSFQAQPSYQTDAVQSYLSNTSNSLPPSFSYSNLFRATPDIVMNGHNYEVVASFNQSNLDSCPCKTVPIDGTSCSSPSLAGLFALINDKLLNLGLSPLGFLNPLLYQMASENPQSFNRITQGSNRCNRGYCCIYGWNASDNIWSPVSGLGSINYLEFEKYILKIKGKQ